MRCPSWPSDHSLLVVGSSGSCHGLSSRRGSKCHGDNGRDVLSEITAPGKVCVRSCLGSWPLFGDLLMLVYFTTMALTTCDEARVVHSARL